MNINENMKKIIPDNIIMDYILQICSNYEEYFVIRKEIT